MRRAGPDRPPRSRASRRRCRGPHFRTPVVRWASSTESGGRRSATARASAAPDGAMPTSVRPSHSSPVRPTWVQSPNTSVAPTRSSPIGPRARAARGSGVAVPPPVERPRSEPRRPGMRVGLGRCHRLGQDRDVRQPCRPHAVAFARLGGARLLAEHPGTSTHAPPEGHPVRAEGGTERHPQRSAAIVDLEGDAAARGAPGVRENGPARDDQHRLRALGCVARAQDAWGRRAADPAGAAPRRPAWTPSRSSRIERRRPRPARRAAVRRPSPRDEGGWRQTRPGSGAAGPPRSPSQASRRRGSPAACFVGRHGPRRS